MLVVFKNAHGEDIALDPSTVYKVEVSDLHDASEGLTDICFCPRSRDAGVDYITVKHPVLEVVEALNKVNGFF